MLVTGASTGIGHACVTHLASRGFVVWAGARQPEGCEWAVAGVCPPVRPVALDVMDAGSIAGAMARIEHEAGGLFGLVNNAGIAVAGPVEAVPLEEWRRQLEVNLLGTIAVTQAALPVLRKHVAQASRGCAPSGKATCARIVMIGSISGLISTPILGPYCASKYALEAVTDALRLELVPQSIGVSMIEPGPVQSDIWKKAEATVASIDRALPVLVPYRSMIEAAERMVGSAKAEAVPAVQVARAVERCLTARRAPIRLQVGPGVWLGAMMKRLLPDRVMDGLKAWEFR